MNKLFTSIICLALCLLLVGCGMNYPELPEDEPGFEPQTVTSDDPEDGGYNSIEYNGRMYVPFGTLKNRIKEKNLDDCIGYIIQENNYMDVRLFTLTEDKDNNFLMEHYIATNWMNPPMFLRALDTKGQDIEIPNYIEDLDYEIWK